MSEKNQHCRPRKKPRGRRDNVGNRLILLSGNLDLSTFYEIINIGDRRSMPSLHEEGIYKAAKAEAVTRVISWQIAEEMRKRGITKTQLAKQMHTSRAQVVTDS